MSTNNNSTSVGASILNNNGIDRIGTPVQNFSNLTSTQQLEQILQLNSLNLSNSSPLNHH
jgi:hypothetical protein